MKIDSVDSVTSYETEIKPLDNGEKFQMSNMSNKPKIKAGSSLSAPIYTPYKPVNPNQQAKKAYNYYIGRGVKPNVAAGIVGNLYKESGLNPNAVGDKGTAYGVAQWRGNRLSNLKNYAAKKGRSYSDLNTQLDYILDEQGENQVLSTMENQSPEQAAQTFADKYERPNPKYADYGTRQSIARQLGQMKYGGFVPKYPDGGNLKSLDTNYFDKWYRKGRLGQLVNNTKDIYQKIKNDGKNLYNVFDKQYPTNEDKISAITNLTGYIPNPYVAIPSVIINTGLDIAGLEDKNNAVDLASNVMQIGLKKRTIPLRIAGKATSSAMDLGNPTDEQLSNNPPKITKKALGGYLPKHGLGAGTILNLISGASTATAGLVDSFNDPDNPKQGLSAISGALQGNAAIPGVGLILGAVSGLKNAQKQKELFEKKEMMKNNQTMDYFKVRSKGILEDYNTQGNQGSFYAKGGKIANPQYEVEHGEVVMGDDVQLTGGQKLASNLHKVVGKTHEQYNPNTVNGTGEDGSGGEFIFSNRLKLGNKTFAQHAETIAKQKAKSEKASNHNDYIFKNTANANIELADSKLQQLAQIQETMKEKANKYGYYKFGGFIPKYGEGEDLEKEGIKLAKRGIFRTSSEQKRLVEINKRLEQLKANNTSKIQRNSVYKPASQPYIDMFQTYPVKKPREITLPEVRVVGKRPSVKTTTSSKKATEPIVDNRINYEAKPLAIKQFDNTKLPDVSNRVDAKAAAKALSTKPGVGGGDKSKLDWTTAASGLMSGLNYMTNNNMINNYKTNVPVSLMQNPNYQYFDRSGLARHSVRGLTNSVMNNPFINQAGKQMAFANSLNATNEIEQQEANRKMDYDRQYRAQLLDTENRNSMIINRAREQQLANENTKLGLRQENLNNMFTNINTGLSENAAMKSNERAMQYLGAAYTNRLGITPEEFAKDPLGILTGKKENVDKQKMGGFIKLKGYKNASK